MSGYFDDWDSRLAQAATTVVDDRGVIGWEALEEQLVWDVTLAAESPGFPDDLRDAIHAAIVEHAVQARPLNHATNPRVDEREDVFRELGRLSFELHSIFHEVANRNLVGFSDSPLAPLRVLFARGEARREDLARRPVHAGLR